MKNLEAVNWKTIRMLLSLPPSAFLTNERRSFDICGEEYNSSEDRNEPRVRGKLELFLGQGHLTAGTGAGWSTLKGYVGHRTFPATCTRAHIQMFGRQVERRRLPRTHNSDCSVTYWFTSPHVFSPEPEFHSFRPLWFTVGSGMSSITRRARG